MASVILSTDFLNDYGRFQNRIRKSVDKLIDRSRQATLPELNATKGIHLEAYSGARDPRARTMRVDDNHRLIVMDLGDGESLVFVKVDTHDNVDRWMMRNEFKVNAATNALEIIDVQGVQEFHAQLVEDAPRLFAHRRDKDFLQLGIGEELLPLLRGLSDDDALEGLIGLIPPTQAEALVELTDPNRTVEAIYADIAGAIDPDAIDTDDLTAAVAAPASQARFHVVTDDEELSRILAAPFATWRTYLHHTQRDLAYRPSYNGPARVTGGAGTGKTVVAIHRAKALAQPYLDGEVAAVGKPILFTTFTRNLAQTIEHDLRQLGGTDLLDLIDVVNVDRLARRIVDDGNPNPPSVAQGSRIGRIWEDIVDEQGLEISPNFLNSEWEQVILAQGIVSRSDYFQARRAGRGIPLDRRARAAVWKATERFTQELTRANARTYLQLAADAAGYLAQRSDHPYRHVVVDEAQDLHEGQWRLLRAAVVEGPDDLFIVGDSHQRIYDRRTSLSKVGINIRGRSRKLRINYRTTAQILGWSMALLGEETYDDLDDGLDEQTLAGYHSLLSGDRPVMQGFASSSEQADALVEVVRGWLSDEDTEPADIGIAARATHLLKPIETRLAHAGIPVLTLDQELPTGEGVRLATMHRMKGLEFRCVAVVDADDDTLPHRSALTDKDADEVQHRHDLQVERCLLYVACTRARDHLWVGWSGNPSRFLGPMLEK